MLTIETRILGKKKPVVPDWSVPAPKDDGDGGLTLRELIARVVRAEVAAFEERQEARKFIRALSEREIAEAAARGKVDPGGSDLEGVVDADTAVAVALQGFEDGLYLVILDDDEMKDLDAQVYLKDDSRMTFLRLAFLAGG